MSILGSPLRITLFGEFGLTYQGQPAGSLNGDRPIALLAYLLLHRQKAVSRQHLAFTFWPDSSDSQARANLRNLFYNLRQTLPEADTYLLADSMTIQWSPEAEYSLDVAQFEEALGAAKTAVSDQERANCLETAVSLYTSDLLPGNYDDWIIPKREELRQAYLDALHQLVHLREGAGEYRAAARLSQRLIQHDPLDETAYVQLMRLHALSGDRAGVRRVYEQCQSALYRDLDVEPGPATQAAYKELLRLDAAPSAPETDRPAPTRPQPLPVPGTTFIGREAEMAHLAELLADPACRLLTIVGPGGIGKTRLALQTAVGHQAVFEDGVVWVSLAALQSPDQLIIAIAENMQQRLSGKGEAEVEIIQVLADKKLLLILDNFEHLLAAAEVLSRILAQTTAVKILTTSRLTLDLQEEWRFDLGELPLPDELAVETLADNSAVQLFIQSARRVASHIVLTETDYPAIAHICHLVGGMPLGIELAASWVRLLSCTEIAQEIEKSLDFLTVNLRNVAPRHRSLRAVFDYSWDLLTLDEQIILARLSVFEGGFMREAAAQVALADLPQLSLLVDRSLVQRSAVGNFNMHSVIRQFAYEYLQEMPSVWCETAERHSSYYLQWLADHEVILRGSGLKDGLNAVSGVLANLRMAWQWAVENKKMGLLHRAAFSLFYFYEVRGLLAEGEAKFQQTVELLQRDAAVDDDETQVAICAMKTYQGYLTFRRGNLKRSGSLLREVAETLPPQKDDFLLSRTMAYLAMVEWSLGRFAEALDYMQTSADLAAGLKADREMITAQFYLAMIKHDQGELEAARQQLSTVLPIARGLGEQRLIANALLIFGRTNLLLDCLTEAEEQLTECISITQETKDPNSITYGTLYLGMVKQAQGDLISARQFIEQSMALYSKYKDSVGLERASVMLGFLEIAAGNYETARTHFLAFLANKQRTHAIRYILSAMVGAAVVQAHCGDSLSALTWTYAVLQHPGLDWEARQRAEELQTQIESNLSAQQIAAAQEQATSQPFEAVLADILNK